MGLAADLRITGVGHVGVRADGFAADEFPQHLFEFSRRRQVGVAQAEVIDVFGAELFFELGPLLEHAPNPGGAGDDGLDFLGNRHGCLSF